MSTHAARVPAGVRTGGRYTSVPRIESQGVLLDAQRDGSLSEPEPVLHAAGFNDEQTDCDACGRRELRGTVVLMDDDGNVAARMGTSCASKTLGRQVRRDAVRAMESTRRSDVVAGLRAANEHLSRGHLAAAAMELRDARRRGVHRPDEVELAARLEHGVEQARRALPQRWGYRTAEGRVVELDTRQEVDAFVVRLSRHGAHPVTMIDGQWVSPDALTQDAHG